MPELLVDKTEAHLMLHGVALLQKETMGYRKRMMECLAPGDNNVPTILEYTDKRSAQLQELQKKIAAYINTA